VSDEQLEFIKNELTSIKNDIQTIQERLTAMRQHFKVCQTRCHVPGPQLSVIATLNDLVNRLIKKVI
jgi:hypothetical protein